MPASDVISKLSWLLLLFCIAVVFDAVTVTVTVAAAVVVLQLLLFLQLIIVAIVAITCYHRLSPRSST